MLLMCDRNGGRRNGIWNLAKILENAIERARRDGLIGVETPKRRAQGRLWRNMTQRRRTNPWAYSLESHSVTSTGEYFRVSLILFNG